MLVKHPSWRLSLILRILNSLSIIKLLTTRLPETLAKTEEIDEKNVTITFFDAPTEKDGKKDADILLLMFSVESYGNFSTLMTKMTDARSFAKNNVASVLVGTKVRTLFFSLTVD